VFVIFSLKIGYDFLMCQLHKGLYVPTWISLSKLLIKSVSMNYDMIMKELK